MARIVLLHSVLGRRGIENNLAHRWEAAGHDVTVPDLYEGRTAETYEAGFAIHDEIGHEAVLARAQEAAAAIQGRAVLAGVSMGAGLVGEVADDVRRPLGVLMLMGAAPLSLRDVPVQAHAAKPDPFDPESYFAEWEAGMDWPDAELFRYPDVGHYFLDPSLPDYDAAAAEACHERVDAFLARF